MWCGWGFEDLSFARGYQIITPLDGGAAWSLMHCLYIITAQGTSKTWQAYAVKCWLGNETLLNLFPIPWWCIFVLWKSGKFFSYNPCKFQTNCQRRYFPICSHAKKVNFPRAALDLPSTARKGYSFLVCINYIVLLKSNVWHINKKYI